MDRWFAKAEAADSEIHGNGCLPISMVLGITSCLFPNQNIQSPCLMIKKTIGCSSIEFYTGVIWYHFFVNKKNSGLVKKMVSPNLQVTQNLFVFSGFCPLIKSFDTVVIVTGFGAYVMDLFVDLCLVVMYGCIAVIEPGCFLKGIQWGSFSFESAIKGE